MAETAAPLEIAISNVGAKRGRKPRANLIDHEARAIGIHEGARLMSDDLHDRRQVAR